MKRWKFAIDNDNSVELVLSGKKTTTTTYKYDENDLPVIWEKAIICFDNG